jgi:dihydroxyacid dehydratase/phosphogluconate dehydratase
VPFFARGLSEEDLDKPFVLVRGPVGDIAPCNPRLTEFMSEVAVGVAQAGGLARQSGTPMADSPPRRAASASGTRVPKRRSGDRWP